MRNSEEFKCQRGNQRGRMPADWILLRDDILGRHHRSGRRIRGNDPLRIDHAGGGHISPISGNLRLGDRRLYDAGERVDQCDMVFRLVNNVHD